MTELSFENELELQLSSSDNYDVHKLNKAFLAEYPGRQLIEFLLTMNKKLTDQQRALITYCLENGITPIPETICPALHNLIAFHTDEDFILLVRILESVHDHVFRLNGLDRLIEISTRNGIDKKAILLVTFARKNAAWNDRIDNILTNIEFDLYSLRRQSVIKDPGFNVKIYELILVLINRLRTIKRQPYYVIFDNERPVRGYSNLDTVTMIARKLHESGEIKSKVTTIQDISKVHRAQKFIPSNLVPYAPPGLGKKTCYGFLSARYYLMKRENSALIQAFDTMDEAEAFNAKFDNKFILVDIQTGQKNEPREVVEEPAEKQKEDVDEDTGEAHGQ